MRRCLLLCLSLATLMLMATTPGTSQASEESLLGRSIEDFELRDVLGKPVSLDEQFAGRKLMVVAFFGIDCPLVKLYAGRLAELAKRFDSDGVAFLAIDSNVQDSLTDAAAFVRRERIEFPFLMDPSGAVASHFGATRTPEVFVLDQSRTVRYHGRIDNQFDVGVQRPEPTRNDLIEALGELLAGNEVSVAETPFPGCLIGRKQNPKTDDPTFTYADHVAAVLHRRCAECHRDGEIAPFPLLTYDDAEPWAGMIAEVVRERRMPPWFASPEYGEFSNACQLPDEERDMILTWVDEGCPPGDLSRVPSPPQFVEGWGIGEPDVIFDMAEKPFKVPATGVVDYQHYVIDPKFEEDMWVSASEARPGARSVVHHILVFAVPPGSSVGAQFLKGRLIAAYAPGVPPTLLKPGQAGFVPKGTRFVMQMHYTPNGREQEDMSQLALKFTTADKVTQRVESGMAINFLLFIQPGDPNATFRASHQFTEDRELLALTPHMHLRGKSFRYEAEYPDGSSEVLLDVPDYDFNWQLTYHLAEPKFMPKGTKLRCTAVFDNSADNPNNPDPTRLVTFGDQTWDEMLIGWFHAGHTKPPTP